MKLFYMIILITVLIPTVSHSTMITSSQYNSVSINTGYQILSFDPFLSPIGTLYSVILTTDNNPSIGYEGDFVCVYSFCDELTLWANTLVIDSTSTSSVVLSSLRSVDAEPNSLLEDESSSITGSVNVFADVPEIVLSVDDFIDTININLEAIFNGQLSYRYPQGFNNDYDVPPTPLNIVYRLDYVYDDGVVAVPEPSAIALMSLGLLGFAATRRRLQK